MTLHFSFTRVVHRLFIHITSGEQRERCKAKLVKRGCCCWLILSVALLPSSFEQKSIFFSTPCYKKKSWVLPSFSLSTQQQQLVADFNGNEGEEIHERLSFMFIYKTPHNIATSIHCWTKLRCRFHTYSARNSSNHRWCRHQQTSCSRRFFLHSSRVSLWHSPLWVANSSHRSLTNLISLANWDFM